MRLKTLTVSGFRGFSRSETLDLDADAVIVHGANGSGKTSMFDAILWVLTGSITRLNGEPKDVVSRYSVSGEARVELEVRRDGSTMKVIRRFDGEDHLTVEDDVAGTTSGAAAELALIELLWPDARGATNPTEALSRSLTRAMYLQQDVVRQFVEADDEQERFSVVSELVGVGRVTELQRQMEGSKKAWSQATNTLEKEIGPVRSQLAALEERYRRLTTGDAPSFQDAAFEHWISEVAATTPEADASGLRRRTSEAIDRTLALLLARQRQEERVIAGLERLLVHLRTPAPDVIVSEPLRAQVHAAETLVAAGSEQLRLAEEAAAAERRRITELTDQVESIRALAQQALRHLGERCPVCDQTYDQAATRARLEALVEASAPSQQLSPVQTVDSAAAQLEAAQRELATAQALVRNAEASEAARAQWDQAATALAADSGLEFSPDLEALAEEWLAVGRDAVLSLQRLRSAGEQFSLQLARVAELAQRTEVEQQIAVLRNDLVAREAEWHSRGETGDLAAALILALRSASTKIVTQELHRIGPLLQRIYATVDPHPSFRAVQFLTRARGGRGRVWTALTDEVEEKTVEDPSLVLSSSQLNVLAVCTFLSLNLAIDTLPLQVVALDDPLQSLDTVNLLGLADLLRRVRSSRQVIVSTHDGRWADLLSRKLRPTGDDRTRVISLDAWSRSGPVVEQFDVPPDMAPLKLVATA
jgi:exonuclease SbcC